MPLLPPMHPAIPAMPLQNRVTPTGDIVADPARGMFMGNRGILHDASRRLGAARWRHRSWICCQLSFKGRRRAVMAPRRYTDEATALAAGHRPCFECRRDAARAFQTAWRRACAMDCCAAAMDRVLHLARVEPHTRRQNRFAAALDDLPDGVFVVLDEAPSTALLVFGDRLLPWRASGYASARPRPAAIRCRVLTPAPIVAVVRAGYAPGLHPSAGRAIG
jgi:hypothetical protein